MHSEHKLEKVHTCKPKLLALLLATSAVDSQLARAQHITCHHVQHRIFITCCRPRQEFSVLVCAVSSKLQAVCFVHTSLHQLACWIDEALYNKWELLLIT